MTPFELIRLLAINLDPIVPQSTHVVVQSRAWLVRIMPFLDESVAAHQWDHGKKYSEASDRVRSIASGVYRCPSRRTASQSIGQGTVVGTEVEWITLPCGCKVSKVTSGGVEAFGAVGDYGGNHGDLSLVRLA